MANVLASSVRAATSGDEPSVTASAILARYFGSHILRIDGYSYTEGLDPRMFFLSETFTVGGHRWCLKYYPTCGCGDPKAESICFSLCLVHSEDDEVKASFTISLLHQDGNPVSAYRRSGGTPTFSLRPGANARCESFAPCLILRSHLEDSDYLKDDVFSVRCDVSLAVEHITTKAITVPAVRRRF